MSDPFRPVASGGDGTAQSPDDEFSGTAPAPPPAKRIACGTDQQEALWAELVGGTAHLIAEARAGAGKSSSCREGMWRMLDRNRGQTLRYLVYNRANADEFRAQCPPGVDVATSHSFGLQALKRAFRSRIEKNKTYLILDETRAGRNLPKSMRKSVAMLVGKGKDQALDPAQGAAEDAALAELRRLAMRYDVNAYGRLDALCEIALGVLVRSADWTEIVDFDDMVWLPGVHGVSLPGADVVFLDEVQDWNPAQHRLVPMMLKAGSRLVAVGDRFQAVNIFRGADEDSMDNLGRMLEGHRALPLTITFRCPRSHVILANAYVPDLCAADGAPAGVVLYDVAIEEMHARVRPGDLVICPANGPVVSACLKRIGAGLPAYVRGRAVGDQLLTVLRGIGDVRTVALAAKGVEAWRARELNRLSGLDGVEDVIESVCDRADGLQAVLSACGSPAEAEPLIGRLFGDEKRANAVTFSTVHRAKGDEADCVWLIDQPTRAPTRPWENRQAKNVRYVALTRGKDLLAFVRPPPKRDLEDE